MGKLSIDVKWLLVIVAIVTFGVGGYFMGNITSQASTTVLEPESSNTIAAITPIESNSSEVNISVSSESSGVLAAPVSDDSSVPILPAPAALTLTSTQLNDMLRAALDGERHFQNLANIVSVIKRNGLAGVEFTPDQIDELATKAIPELTYAQDRVGDYVAIAGVSDTIINAFRTNPEYSQPCYESLGCGIE